MPFFKAPSDGEGSLSGHWAHRRACGHAPRALARRPARGTFKDCLKELFCVRYGDIQYANQCVAAWYVHLTDGLEDTIAAWLKDMVWEAVVDDTREDEDEDECE